MPFVGGGLSSGIIAGISIAGVVGVLLLAVSIYVGLYRKKKLQDNILLSETYETRSLQATRGTHPYFPTFSLSYLSLWTLKVVLRGYSWLEVPILIHFPPKNFKEKIFQSL